MVNKRKIVYIISVLTFLLISTVVYLSYFSQPSTFLTEQQIIAEINKKPHLKANVKEVQAILTLSKRNIYVPFITSDDSYGKSFWVWDKYRWRLAYVNTGGSPRIWKVNNNDPTSYHVVWNLHPEDQIKHVKFYMIRDRGYSTTGGEDRKYYPRVQVQQTISLKEASYGVLKIPKEWATFVTSINETHATSSDVFFNFMPTERQVLYGWALYNEQNELTFPSKSVNGRSSKSGEIELEFVRFLNDSEIEKSSND
jgi:hypothetical protein